MALFVMAGLVPAIHGRGEDVDARHNPQVKTAG
jgi:hypothetical protein